RPESCRVTQLAPGHAELLVRFLAKTLFARFTKHAPSNDLRHPQRLVAGRIELQRLRAGHTLEQIDDEVVRTRQVAPDFGVSEIPAAVLGHEREDPLPRFIVA